MGYYWLAFQVSHYALTAKTAINSILFPTFAQVKSKAERYKLFDIVIRLTSALYTLTALIILIFGKYFIILIYGEKWLPAVLPLKIFFIIVVIRAIGGNAGPLLYSLGKTKQDLKLAIINAITLPIFVAIGTYYFGIVGAAVGVLISSGLNAFYGFGKYIVPLTKKTNYFYYGKAVTFLGLIGIILLIMSYSIHIDDIRIDLIFLIISCLVYWMFFRSELTLLKNMVFNKLKT